MPAWAAEEAFTGPLGACRCARESRTGRREPELQRCGLGPLTPSKSVLARMFAPSKDLISGIKISERSDRYTAGAQYILAEIG